MYDTHMHTPLCKHATGQPEEYAAVAQQKGLKGIVITCHSPIDGMKWGPEVRMETNQFDEYLVMVERARKTWKGRIDVCLGLESDYVPGLEPWLEDLHSRADFHYILGSVHPHLHEYRDRYFNGDIITFQKEYFDILVMAAETGYFDSLAHPDFVKVVHPYQWSPEVLMDHINHCLDRIAVTGTAMELNTSGLNKMPAEMNPGHSILVEMQRRNIPVVVGSDAHSPQRVGADFGLALDQLRDIGYTHVSIFLNRKRQDIDIEVARQSLCLDLL